MSEQTIARDIQMTDDEFRELWMEDMLSEIEDEVDDNWRHGTNHRTVFELQEEVSNDGNGFSILKDTGIFYRANYRVSGDGEYHGIRDRSFKLFRVWPRIVTITKTVYDKIQPE